MPAFPCDMPEFGDLSQEILSRGAILRFRARGGSMRPLVCEGDLLEIAPTPAVHLRTGDIVFFRSEEGSILVHRLVHRAIEEGQIVLTTRGDACARADRPLRAPAMVGRVVALERRGKRVNLDRGCALVVAKLVALSPTWLLQALHTVNRLRRTAFCRLAGPGESG